MIQIWTPNRRLSPRNGFHSSAAGYNRIPARRAQIPTHTIPRENRRKAVQKGGNASSPSLTATGWPPHRQFIVTATAIAVQGIGTVFGYLSGRPGPRPE